MSVLYITQNGVTDHIGRSQVAPYVLSLARLGFHIHVLSAEKPGREALIHEYEQEFRGANVQWSRVRYHNYPPIIGQAWTQASMLRSTRGIVRRERIQLIHSRGFLPALIAYRLKGGMGVKYIFDFRDFYADGGLFKEHALRRIVFQRLKRLEGPMIRSADKVVCLTRRAEELLSDWYLQGTASAGRFQVIPCCADFSHFDPCRLSETEIESARRRARLQKGDFVLLYLGSLGADYLLPQMMSLFRQVLAIRSSAHFLFVSNNGRELVDAESDVQRVPRDRIRFVSADRKEVPAFIALAALSVVFIRADLSKAGCSPTKLAELFACDVPVIANAVVGDMDSIIDLKKNGSFLVKDFSDASLRSAVEQVLAFKESGELSIRDSSLEFAIEEGVARYAAVYRELLS